MTNPDLAVIANSPWSKFAALATANEVLAESRGLPRGVGALAYGVGEAVDLGARYILSEHVQTFLAANPEYQAYLLPAQAVAFLAKVWISKKVLDLATPTRMGVPPRAIPADKLTTKKTSAAPSTSSSSKSNGAKSTEARRVTFWDLLLVRSGTLVAEYAFKPTVTAVAPDVCKSMGALCNKDLVDQLIAKL